MKKYKILILSNLKGSGLQEDTILKNAFEKDGHTATLDTVCFDKTLDETFDVIIRRNTWVSTENETNQLYIDNENLIKRLLSKNIKTVNLIGLDGKGKGYLCDLFKKYDNVLPTICTLKDVNLLPNVDKYVVKNIKSFGNGLHQRNVLADELCENYTEGDIIQPFTKFIAEVQCYYVAKKLMYVYEYRPSKYPDYPEPTLISFSETEKNLADNFAKYSNMEYGFQRIDFLRLEDDSLLLMEIEDHAPSMGLQRLKQPLLDEVLKEYTQNIYNLIEKR